jgi:hypothetical protein
MAITVASNHGLFRGRGPFDVQFPGVTPQSYCWATICELDSNLQPMYGGAFLTIEQVVPGNGIVNGRLWIDNVPVNIESRFTVFHYTGSAGVSLFTVKSKVRRGHGHVPCPISDSSFIGHPNIWATVTEIDATGARPIYGDAFLTVSQVVPDPVHGNVNVAVWIDNVPGDISYQVTVTGLL